MMFPVEYTVILFLKVLLAFYLLYIFIPSKAVTFDEFSDDWTDRIFISLTHSNFIIIVLVHLLVLFKIYETISLTISIIAILLAYFSIRKNFVIKSDHITKKEIGFLAVSLDLVDGKAGLLGGPKKYVKAYLSKLPDKLKNAFIHFFVHPFAGILLVGVFVIAAIIRFRHSFSFLYYGASDCYVHLAWTKYLGINNIYQDGVYPYGYEAIISAMHKLFFIDPSVIIRFFGGMGSFLIVFSIYYILKKNFKNQYLIIFIGVAAYVLGTELPNASNNTWRQLSALPQEYAAIFLLPGFHFFNLFFTTNKKTYLVLAAEVLAITMFIHFYVALFLIIGYAILALLNFNKVFKGKTFIQLLASMSLATIIGLLPIGIALAVGMKFHALSLGFVVESATTSVKLNWREEIFRYVETNPTMKLFMIFALVILAYAFIRIFFRKTPEYTGKIKLFVMFVLLTAFTYTQVRSIDIGFPSVLEFSRASTFLGIIVVVLFAMVVYIVEFFPFHKLIKYIFKLALGVVIITTVFQVQNYKLLLPVGAKLEYNDAAYGYYKIKSEFPLLNWTIISPVEQYQQSLGYGWHYNLWQFVEDTQIKTKDKIEFPTDYIFVFIEKRPLNQSQPYVLTNPISPEDYNQPFPDVGLSYEKFYTNYKNRRVIEAKAYYWLENYIQQKGNFTVYLENDVLKIYMLKQDGTKPINLAN